MIIIMMTKKFFSINDEKEKIQQEQRIEHKKIK